MLKHFLRKIEMEW